MELSVRHLEAIAGTGELTISKVYIFGGISRSFQENIESDFYLFFFLGVLNSSS